jgi:IS4 transposase
LKIWSPISDAKTHDSRISKELFLKPGSIVAIDRGVCRFRSVSFLDGTGNLLRHENEGQYRLCSGRSPYAAEWKDDRLRQDRTPDGNGCEEVPRAASEDRREEPGEGQRGDRPFAPNHLQFGASRISAIYKGRWEIELFFKTLKQNLKVKTFVGESENALLIQIWTALIPRGTFSCSFRSERAIHLVSLLMIKWLHYLSKSGWSFSNLASMLRLSLFTYRELRI